ncbi:Protein ASP-1 protein7, partial [Aphelenchoides avenae]
MSQLDDDIGYMPIDGFFGIGWPDLSAFEVTPPAFNALGQLDQPVFSVWLDKHPVPSATYTGSITFGGLDTRHCDSNWMWTPLEQYQSRYNYWIFHLDTFSLGPGNDFVVQDQCSTDTGVSWINAPSHIVDAIASRTNTEYQFKDGIYTVACDATSLPDFTFIPAGGATLTISPDVYLLK